MSPLNNQARQSLNTKSLQPKGKKNPKTTQQKPSKLIPPYIIAILWCFKQWWSPRLFMQT